MRADASESADIIYRLRRKCPRIRIASFPHFNFLFVQIKYTSNMAAWVVHTVQCHLVNMTLDSVKNLMRDHNKRWMRK